MKANNRFTPCSKSKEALYALALFVVVLGFYSLTWFQGLNVGVSTIGAERVLRGEIPYRDFWTMYAPGHFYLLALLFRIFGTHVLVEAIATSVVCAATGLLCYWLVLTLTGRRLAAIACMGIFLAATHNAGYFKFLGSYPPAIFSIVAALNFVALYYKTGTLGHLVGAGVATGAAVVFKHDVGGYTAIAIAAGLFAHHFAVSLATENRQRSLLSKLTGYGAGVTVVALPIYIFFAVVAGKDLWQDLVIFPLTDFRFARPEHYPGLFEFNIRGESFLKAVSELFTYVSFAMPFLLFLCGLMAMGLALTKRNPVYVALGVTFSIAYLLHYTAAHVQINTHLISMSIYAAFLAVIFFDLLECEFGFRRPALAKGLSLALVSGWLLSLAAEPTDKALANWKRPTTELSFDKVSGLKVAPALASNYSELLAFVDKHLPPDGKLFIGLHRHDVVIVGANAPDYFVLDRPIATRYHEIHPAVVDTAEIQREIIRDLQEKKVSFLILKRIRTDDRLELVKRDFLRNLPRIGATDLDTFIQSNYVQVQTIGNNAIWKRKDSIARVAG
jgi:hypothetical protein